MSKPASAIERWEDWPADVLPILRAWNKKSRVLRFESLIRQPFQCQICDERCEPHRYGRAELFGKPLCDDCLIEFARPAVGEKS